MNHVTEKMLIRYQMDSLEQDEQQEIENHLADCEDCFAMYALSLEDAPSPLPATFTEDATAEIVKQHPAFRKKEVPRSRTLIHYAVAAGFTLLLMGSGAFTYMTERIDQAQLEKQPSFSEQMMERTEGWFDQNRFEKGDGRYE